MKNLIALLILLVVCTVRLNAGEAPGEPGFLLGGTAINAQDPQNPANDVIKIDTTSPPSCDPPPIGNYINCAFGTVSRRLNVKIATLTNMVEVKAYFQAPRGCGGGSPRITLSIDLNGTGTPTGNAHGNYGPGPFGTGCPPAGMWQYEDLTDNAPRWDVTQFAAIVALLPTGLNPFLVPWPVLQNILTTNFPNHNVCSGALVDDSGWTDAAEGVAYYDLLSLGRATWENGDDSVGRGFAMGCGRPDDGDIEVPGDENHDHVVNDDDSTWVSRHSGH
jgi:hypothetical protein